MATYKRYNKYCSMPGCKAGRKDDPNISMFRFPLKDKDQTRCQEWIKFVGLDPSSKLLKTRRICSNHFTDDQFMNPAKNKLIWNAVPTIRKPKDMSEILKKTMFPLLNDPETFILIQSPQCDSKETRNGNSLISLARHYSDMPTANQRKDLVKRKSTKPQMIYLNENEKLKKLKREEKDKIENCLEIAKSFLPQEAFGLFRTQLLTSTEFHKPKAWSQADRRFACRLFLTNRTAYAKLRKTFKLPPSFTVTKWLTRNAKNYNTSRLKKE